MPPVKTGDARGVPRQSSERASLLWRCLATRPSRSVGTRRLCGPRLLGVCLFISAPGCGAWYDGERLDNLVIPQPGDKREQEGGGWKPEGAQA